MVSSPPMTARRTSSSTTPPSRLTATAASRTTSGSNTPSPGATRAPGPSRFARFETTPLGRETGVRESLLATPDCRTRRLSVTDFYGIQTGTIPGFAEAGGGTFMGVQGLPDQTVENMVTLMARPRPYLSCVTWSSTANCSAGGARGGTPKGLVGRRRRVAARAGFIITSMRSSGSSLQRLGKPLPAACLVVHRPHQEGSCRIGQSGDDADELAMKIVRSALLMI